jgi:hypothetical protein
VKSPILIIGEWPGFARNGGMINFYLEKEKVRFEVNRQAITTAGLSISSDLLNLSRIVE